MCYQEVFQHYSSYHLVTWSYSIVHFPLPVLLLLLHLMICPELYYLGQFPHAEVEKLLQAKHLQFMNSALPKIHLCSYLDLILFTDICFLPDRLCFCPEVYYLVQFPEAQHDYFVLPRNCYTALLIVDYNFSLIHLH
jgi:hypothetical protein